MNDTSVLVILDILTSIDNEHTNPPFHKLLPYCPMFVAGDPQLIPAGPNKDLTGILLYLVQNPSITVALYYIIHPPSSPS